MFENGISNLERVSVVVNVWCEDDVLAFGRSLTSIAKQNHKPDEVIIVVDGPIDSNLRDSIQEFTDQADFPVKKTEIQMAAGLWTARNVGIGVADFDLIALHDADDVMHPDRLKMQLAQMSTENIDVLASPVYEFDSVSEQIIGLRALSRSEQINQKMIWQNVINHSSVMLRKSAVTSVGGYKNVYLAEDYDLWLRLIRAGKKLDVSKFVLQAFSVDKKLNKRRGGREFISSELNIHRLVTSTKGLNRIKLWIRLLMRLTYRLGPSRVRQKHRLFFQTKRPINSPRSLEEFLNQPPLKINQ